jgi:predicted nucleotidyltransferase
MMGLRETIKKTSQEFQKEGISHALIGGLALGAHGVHRSTQDVDFLVEGTQREKVISCLKRLGFNPFHMTQEVLQFDGPGRIDILLANRPATLKMLQSAQMDSKILHVKVVGVEDLIGLKIQAYKNDPLRELQDKADIQSLLLKNKDKLNVQLVKTYADLFGEWDIVKSLGGLHDNG